MKNARMVLVSVGNKIKKDDDVANIVLGKIPEKENILKINSGLNPENFIKDIEKFSPEKIFFIDAMRFGGKPGAVKLFTIDEVETLAPSTHNTPIGVFKRFFPKTEIFVIGIQPKNLDYGFGLSEELEKKIKSIASEIRRMTGI